MSTHVPKAFVNKRKLSNQNESSIQDQKVSEKIARIDGKITAHENLTNSNEASSTVINKLPSSSSNITEKLDKKQFIPKYVVRPLPSLTTTTPIRSDNSFLKCYLSVSDIWIHIFHFLQQSDLVKCMRVCKTWYKWCLHRSLWREVNVSCRPLRQTHLLGIVYRQPVGLDISWTNVSRQQLEWLIARQPYLKSLKLAGCSWAAVSALCSSCCPFLQQLTLNWVDGVFDNCIEDLVLPPTDHRPGIDESLSRLHRCTVLELAGTNITDAAISTILCHMPFLKSLDVSCCVKLSNDCVKTLSTQAKSTLTNLRMSGCHGLTDDVFTYFLQLTNLSFLDLSLAVQISTEASLQFIAATGDKFVLVGDRQFKIKCK